MYYFLHSTVTLLSVNTTTPPLTSVSFYRNLLFVLHAAATTFIPLGTVSATCTAYKGRLPCGSLQSINDPSSHLGPEPIFFSFSTHTSNFFPYPYYHLSFLYRYRIRDIQNGRNHKNTSTVMSVRLLRLSPAQNVASLP